MSSVSVNGSEDYIPPLSVGCECHWGRVILYLHYMSGVSVTEGRGWLYTSTKCGVWVSLGEGDSIPPLYVRCECHRGEGVIIYPHYMWGVSVAGVGGGGMIINIYIETHCWQHSASIDFV